MVMMAQHGCGKKLKNDVAIFTVRKDQIPVIYFRVMLMAGSADDPAGKKGLASFTANLMRRGTASYSRRDIEDTLDYIASDLWISCQKDTIVFGGRTIADDLEKFYDIFSEVLLKPSFDEEEIEKLKADQIDEIEAVRQQDEALAREAFNNFIYSGHPYDHLDAGTISSIKSFTRQDVLNFYREHFRREKFLGGLAGAIPDWLTRSMKDDLSSFPSGGILRKIDRTAIPGGKKVLIIEKEGRSQTHLRIGHPIPVTRRDPAYFPLLLANNFLGKHRVSIGKLYNEVREKRGLSYGAYSYIEHFLGTSGPIKLPLPNLARREQYFSMWIYPKAENAKFVLKLALKEMNDLVMRGIEDRKLEEAKIFTVNNFPFEVETPDRELAMKLDDILYGSRDLAANFEKNVRSVTPDDLKKAVRDFLFPDRVAIAALVSDGEQFIDNLLSPETAIEYPSGVDPRILEREDSVIKSYDLRLRREDFKIVKASELFQ